MIQVGFWIGPVIISQPRSDNGTPVATVDGVRRLLQQLDRM